jgi:hypothetical protein
MKPGDGSLDDCFGSDSDSDSNTPNRVLLDRAIGDILGL